MEKKGFDKKDNILKIAFVIMFSLYIFWKIINLLLLPDLKGRVCYEHDEIIYFLDNISFFMAIIASILGIVFIIKSNNINKNFYYKFTILLFFSFVFPFLLSFGGYLIRKNDKSGVCEVEWNNVMYDNDFSKGN